jgi:hypothetical protein
MKKMNVDLFEKIDAQLQALLGELGQLAKKSPDNAVNKFKLKFINSILVNANTLLGDKYRPFADFEVFDEDELPTNSDAALVVAQYINCMEKLRSDNIHQDAGYWVWRVDDGTNDIRTAPPKKLERR